MNVASSFPTKKSQHHLCYETLISTIPLNCQIPRPCLMLACRLPPADWTRARWPAGPTHTTHPRNPEAGAGVSRRWLLTPRTPDNQDCTLANVRRLVLRIGYEDHSYLGGVTQGLGPAQPSQSLGYVMIKVITKVPPHTAQNFCFALSIEKKLSWYSMEFHVYKNATQIST